MVADRTLGAFLEEALAPQPLLLASARVFVRRGYDAATVEDILREASVSRRTFYKAYRGKEEAVVALHRVGSELLLGALRAAASSPGTDEERLGRMVDVFLASAKGSSGLTVELQALAQRRGSPLAPRRAEVTAELVAIGHEHVSAALAPVEWLALFSAIEGLTRGIVTSGRAGDELERSARETLVRLYRGLVAQR